MLVSWEPESDGDVRPDEYVTKDVISRECPEKLLEFYDK